MNLSATAEMAGDIGVPGPSASFLFPSDVMEQHFGEEGELARQLETPNEAYMVVEMIERELEDVCSKHKTIEDNLKRLKRYIESDKRRKSYELSSNSVSPVADGLISTSEGPLAPSELRGFLLEKVLGKPRPCVLPIVRRYTRHTSALIGQLLRLRDDLNREHELHMKHRALDVNLVRRVERLIKNIEREVEHEGREGRRQTSIFQFTHSTPRT